MVLPQGLRCARFSEATSSSERHQSEYRHSDSFASNTTVQIGGDLYHDFLSFAPHRSSQHAETFYVGVVWDNHRINLLWPCFLRFVYM